MKIFSMKNKYYFYLLKFKNNLFINFIYKIKIKYIYLKMKSYINESIIEGHGNPITVERFIDILQKGKNAMFKI